MEELLKFVKYTDISEPQVEVIEDRFYIYYGQVRDDLVDDLIKNVLSKINGDQSETDKVIQRLRDFITLIFSYKIAPYIHLELELWCKGTEYVSNKPRCWHRESLYDDPLFRGAKFTVAITGDTTLFIPTNDYNRDMIEREESGESVDLQEMFKNEVVVFSKSDEVSIFGGYENGIIHSDPCNMSNRIFLNAVFGSYDEIHCDATCANEEDNWNRLPSEQLNL